MVNASSGAFFLLMGWPDASSSIAGPTSGRGSLTWWWISAREDVMGEGESE